MRAGISLGGLAGSVFGLLLGCTEPEPGAPTLALWHTFGPAETEALNGSLPALERDLDVRVLPTVIPFGRAQNRLNSVLGEGSRCPDLVRIDATWLPELVTRGLLLPAPAGAAEGFTAESAELARWNETTWGLPQSLDGLALLYDAQRVTSAGADVAWPPTTLDELEAAARRLTGPAGHGMSVRGDGYWFLAWLRAAGATWSPEGDGPARAVSTPAAAKALTRYARLAAPGGVAPPVALGGDEAGVESTRFLRREVAILVGGPWSIPALEGRGIDLAVAPYPRGPAGEPAAPRGAQLYVVPRCAPQPAAAWTLATALTASALQVDWSRRLGTVPTRPDALAAAAPLARAFAAALESARPLPRHPSTPALFDDLTPAVQAVLAGDATADEALAGVARSWTRVLAQARPEDAR